MNLNPGGKQAKMRNGWFTQDGQHVEQSMVFSPDHEDHPGMAKGMLAVLKECGLSCVGLKKKCDTACADVAVDCCATRILSLQPDFLQQKSLVQETIEAEGLSLQLFIALMEI